MNQPEEQPYYKKSQTLSTSKNAIKRIKGHEAILKVKQVMSNIDMMKRRNKYLQVRDQLNRSLTIQHERKLMQHDQRRQEAQRQRDQLEKYFRRRDYQVQTTREKNMVVKDQREKKIEEMCEKYLNEKIQAYQTIKTERVKNQQLKAKNKQSDHKEKQQIRKSINDMEEVSRTNISRFRQNRYKDSVNYKEGQFNSLMNLAANKQKQLEMLSKMEEQMVKKNSASMQASQVVRNRLKQVLGDDRRFTRLPSIKNGSPSASRGSTSNTHIVVL